ncbi:MAG: YggS family pyridoxal phosphate-dependent enzyme [Endomicrobiaceae bacterium]|nr:YggS family pyridoxal phosphate-dependent enzyme [Endomicrobiaceae bacterium]
MVNISENIAFIRDRISDVSNSRNVSIVAVTKTFKADYVESAIMSGITDIAESKIQEALPKFDVLSNKEVLKNVKKHFIGHLQSNKVKKTVSNFDLIQSLDSRELASDINRHARDINKIQECLIELKVSQEITKHGVSEEQAAGIYDYCIENCQNIKICGIMTIAPYFELKEEVRPYFKTAYNIFLKLKHRFNNKDFSVLSMGMSDDFEIAVQEGSNMVRIGSAVFGERIYDK